MVGEAGDGPLPSSDRLSGGVIVDLVWMTLFIGVVVLSLTGVARRRWPDVPLGWPLSAFAAWIPWLVILLGRPSTPRVDRWLPWLPKTWLETWGLTAQWDALRWAVLLIGATLWLVALLAEVPAIQARSPGLPDWTLGWLLVAAGFWSVLPQSPGGLWWAWALMDVAALLLALYLWPDAETRLRWLWHTTARSLSWGAAFLWSVHAGSAPLTQPLAFPGARTWLLAVVLWRFLWSGPTGTGTPRQPFWHRTGRLFLTWLILGSTLPALLALAQWPVASTPWPAAAVFWGLGFIGVWVGMARWLGSPSLEEGFPGLVTTWGWMAVLSAWYGLLPATLFWGGLPWLLGAAVVLFRLPEARLAPLWGLLGLTLTFWPFTPGQAGLELWTETPWWVGLWSGLVLVLSLLGGLPISALRGRSLDAQPRWVQVFYPLGMVVLTLALWRWGWVLPVPQSVSSVSVFAWLVGPSILLATGLAGWYLWRHQQRLEQWGRALTRPLRFFLGLAAALYRGTVQAVENGLYFLSLVFEGEAGLMWAMAFLAAIALFLMGR